MTWLRPSRLTAAIAAALLAVATLTSSAAAGSPGAVTCQYSSSGWGASVIADVTIVNNGPVIDGWTVELTFDTPTTLGSAWNAYMAQPDPVTMTADSMPFNQVIPPDRTVAFGWVASAVRHEAPAVSVNGAPC